MEIIILILAKQLKNIDISNFLSFRELQDIARKNRGGTFSKNIQWMRY